MTRKSESLEKAAPAGPLAVPEYLKQYAGQNAGAELIGTEDIRPPALRIAQSMSKQIKRTEPDYIEGLREGEFYNNLTCQNYGESSLKFIVIQALGHRHVEFNPLSEGGGVKDFNVPDEDPRTKFTSRVVDGKEVRIKPAATKFYDYLILVVHDEQPPELMALSLKGTALKNATRLNTLIKVAQLPTFCLLFTAKPVPEKKKEFSYYNWKIDRAGFPSEELAESARKLQETLKGKKVDLSAATEGEEPSEPGSPADDDIPF